MYYVNFPGMRKDIWDVCAVCRRKISAVTAACMMVKTSVFKAVGGFDEELKVAFNDIDFCMKLRKAGYLIVYNPICGIIPL